MNSKENNIFDTKGQNKVYPVHQSHFEKKAIRNQLTNDRKTELYLETNNDLE